MIQNISRALGDAELSLGDRVRVTAHLTNIEDRPVMDEVNREFFVTEVPARSTVAIEALAGEDLLFEADIVATTRNYPPLT